MERVALHLQKKAISSRASHEDLDLFGRSAFNRYYYSMFLIVREMLLGMRPGWAVLAHKDVPEMLSGTVVRVLKEARRRTHRVGDTESMDLCNQAISASLSLAELMTKGYVTRVAADYNPDIPVILSGKDRFSLNKVSINAAHEWPTRAKALVKVVDRGWVLTDG